MKVLVIGSGGREHALVTQLKKDNRVTQIFAAPGNDGIGEMATVVPIDVADVKGLLSFAKKEGMDLTIVGPEASLMAGVVNAFNDAGLPIFGPTKESALIEGSKLFAKQLMEKYGIPTGGYAAFKDYEKAKAYLKTITPPIVLKADGLCGGKGVIIAENEADALKALKEMMCDKAFGTACDEIIIEEFLEGEEYSLMAFVSGKKVYPMVVAQDHKRIGEGEMGLNTGGMGAYAPVPQIPKTIVEQSIKAVLEKTAEAMVEEGLPFTGFLYGGLILTKDGPKVIEFNCRLGDPEAEVVLPLLEGSLGQIIKAVLEGREPEISWQKKQAFGVFVVGKGYPGTPEKGVNLEAIMRDESLLYYHGATRKDRSGFVSDGGRVLMVVAVEDCLKKGHNKVYNALAVLENDKGLYYRSDIGFKAFKYLEEVERKDG